MTGGISIAARDMLREQGFAPEPLYGIIKTMVIKYYNVYIQGITIPNDNGGMEFYAPSHFDKPITLFHDYTTTITYHRKKRSDSCCLFANMIDYFAYKTMQHKKQHSDVLPFRCDCVIMNKPINFLNATIEVEGYNHVYSFLPLDDVGISMYKTLQERNPSIIEDMSPLYNKEEYLYKIIKK